MNMSNWLIKEEARTNNLFFFRYNKIRKICSDIQVKDLNEDDGVEILIKKLKTHFAKDTNQATFLAYGKFKSFRRVAVINITDFI